MDRLLITRRTLVAACGLAVSLASTGCRDRNVQVPPPAHYTDGAVAYPDGGGVPQGGGYPGYAPGPDETSAVEPYDGTTYGVPGTFDPAASPTSNAYDSLGYPIGSGSPSNDDSAGFGVPPIEGAAAGEGFGAGPYASSSSPAASFATESYGDPVAPAGAPGALLSPPPSAAAIGVEPAETPGAPGPATFPGLDAGTEVPPIPDGLPDLP